MQVIRDLAQAANIADPVLRQLIQQTIHNLSADSPYDANELGVMLVIEDRDTIADINTQLGFDIFANRYTKRQFGQPDFEPCWEFLVAHPGYWEAVYVLDQSGHGVTVFVSQSSGVPAELRALCQRYAAG